MGTLAHQKSARKHAARIALGLALVASPQGRVMAQEPAAPAPEAPFVPTPMEVVEQMLAPARVGPGDVVYDLGCGDGRIVITAAKRFGARGVGIDIDPALVAESRRNADTAGVAAWAEFRQGDLFEADLQEATVVTLYILRGLNERLRPKLLRELRPGTRIVSHNFDMGDWLPDSAVEVTGTGVAKHFVLYWVLPADVAGTWELSVSGGGPGRRYRVRFEQHYQRLSGTATAGGRPVRVANARLVGDRLAFTLADPRNGGAVTLHFTGRVSGETASGVLTADRGGPGQRAWRAIRLSPAARTRPGPADETGRVERP